MYKQYEAVNSASHGAYFRGGGYPDFFHHEKQALFDLLNAGKIVKMATFIVGYVTGLLICQKAF